MKVKDTDMLHYLSDFVNFMPDVRDAVEGELQLNGVSKNNIKTILTDLFVELSEFWRDNPNATKQDNMNKVNDLITRIGGQVSGQTHNLIVRSVEEYPAYKQESYSILESAFPKRDRSVIQFFHDQKSDGFYQDMKTGRYSISEQQIGKATVNVSTTQKSNAQNQITRDEQEIDKGEQDVK